MCEHCRSVRAENGMTAHEKSVSFARSQEKPSTANSKSQRLEMPATDGAFCAQWRKSCCGGGCCDRAISDSPCCGAQQAAATVRQTQPPQYRKSMYHPDSAGGPSGQAQFGHPANRLDCNRNAGTNALAASCGIGGSTYGMGVCPAMMRNLPCTPILEPKCFGGDCRDEDTDSEHSAQI